MGSILVYGFFSLDQQALPLLLGLGLTGSAVVAAVKTVFVFRDRASRERHGRLLPGEVSSVGEHYVTTSYAGHVELWIHYRFTTPTGEDRTGAVTARAGRWRPKLSPGDQLAILYADGICEQVL